MIRILLATSLACAVSAPAMAATLRNLDPEPTRVTVSEDGIRSEVEVASGETRTLCEGGCFITFANGEMLPLTGSESVVVEGGAGRIEP